MWSSPKLSQSLPSYFNDAKVQPEMPDLAQSRDLCLKPVQKEEKIKKEKTPIEIKLCKRYVIIFITIN